MTNSPLPSIDITIDEVVLRGIEPGDQFRFVSALEARLTAMIEADIGRAAQWRSRDEASRRTTPVRADTGAVSLGEAVAASVSDVVSDRRGDGR